MSKNETIAGRAERIHWMEVAQEIGDAHRDCGGAMLGNTSAPALVHSSRKLSSYAHWASCVDELGIVDAVRHAQIGYIARDQAIDRCAAKGDA